MQRPSGQNFNLNIFYVARNGSWTQKLRMRWIGNGWATANRVVEGLGGKVLYEQISDNFPRDVDGKIEWDAKPAKPEQQTVPANPARQ